MLSTLFRRLDLELYDTIQERDVDVVRDLLVGEASPESKGVKVRLARHD